MIDRGFSALANCRFFVCQSGQKTELPLSARKNRVSLRHVRDVLKAWNLALVDRLVLCDL